ncbi:hypothetical protein ACFQ93_18080 [Streptomyces sp. NPDC056601]|uniref:hypothetical protein n=1 Tax=Streptomyces sp. NPDC056601 TaxID=3345875 RepID=UPI00369941AD
MRDRPLRRGAPGVGGGVHDDRPVALDEYPVHQVPLSMKHVATGRLRRSDSYVAALDRDVLWASATQS